MELLFTDWCGHTIGVEAVCSDMAGSKCLQLHIIPTYVMREINQSLSLRAHS